MPIAIHPHAPFTEYDLRGVYPDEVHEDLFEKVGRAACAQLEWANQTIVVGRDLRNSSPLLKRALIRGLVDGGAQVIDCGPSTSPGTVWALHHFKAQASAQVTASHNPPDYGGLKLTDRKGPIGYKNGFNEIRASLDEDALPREGNGQCREAWVMGEYAQFLASFLNLSGPLRVAVDCGNGVVSLLFQHLSPYLGQLEVIPVNSDPNGYFSDRSPNPGSPNALKRLLEVTAREKAQFGVAFDGDGDRCLFVNEKGTPLRSDIAALVLSKSSRPLERPSTVVFDHRFSRAFSEELNSLGVNSHPTQVGHVHLKHAMNRLEADLGAELSGHFYFKDFFHSDSGVLAFIKMANLLSRSPPLSELSSAFDKYEHSGELTISLPFQRNLQAADFTIPNTSVEAEFGGLTVRGEDWWASVRSSRTEPAVRLVVEATNREKLADATRLLTERARASEDS